MIAAFDGLRFKRRYNGSKASLFIMRTMWENNSKTSHFARKKVLDWNHASVASYILFLLISDTNCFFTSFGWTSICFFKIRFNFPGPFLCYKIRKKDFQEYFDHPKEVKNQLGWKKKKWQILASLAFLVFFIRIAFLQVFCVWWSIVWS